MNLPPNLPTVRTARPDDSEAWRALRAALWPESDGDPGEHAREINEHFERDDARWPREALLAEQDGAVVGFAEVSVRPYAEGCAAGDVGYLEGWYVDPAHRGTGIGRALVAAAEDWCRSRGCKEMASDADPDNTTSLLAHEACGFEDVGLVRCFRKGLDT